MHSIRSFLIVNLLLSISLITLLTVVGNLFFAHKDIEQQLDYSLEQTAKSMAAFLGNFDTLSAFHATQQQLNQQNKKIRTFQNTTVSLGNQIEFQVWHPDKQLLLYSSAAPVAPFIQNRKTGLSHVWLEGYWWTVFTLHTKKNKLSVMVARRSNYRQQLENQLTKDFITIMLMTYPLLGFLIWVIIGRGLTPLNNIVCAVRNRAPRKLKPVVVEPIPQEIEPLVTELNNLFCRLKDAFDREKRFASDAAHELKTPLATLSAQAQTALSATSDTERTACLNKLIHGVQRSTHAIEQLLTLSRMMPEAASKQLYNLSLIEELEDTLALLALPAMEKSIELSLQYEESKAPYVIQGNGPAIGILVRNLLDNAIRYTPSGGKVTLSLKKHKHAIHLVVTDTGPGISEDLRERVLERFYRIAGTKERGSGLGLSIVHEISKLHKATMLLNNCIQNKGLRVEIIFPIQK